MTLNRIFLKTGIVMLLLSWLACSSGDSGRFRVLTAGISHETNTFIPRMTTMEDFTIRRGDEVLRDQPWASYLMAEGVEVIPTLHAYSGPSGLISKDTYEELRDEIIGRIRESGPVDGIFLDMHGAMHVEGYPDAQVDFIQQIRREVGNKVVIAASFDLHGNISPEFIQGLNIVSAYRTAPHVDGDETRVRTVKLLVDALRNDLLPQTAHLNLPVLIPGEKGITSVEPLKSLYARLDQISAMDGLMDASIFVGMPWTDVERAGMSVQVVARDKQYLPLARKQAALLADSIWEQRDKLQFDVPTAPIDQAIETALEAPESTVFITDSGDNITAGAAGDGTLVLKQLLDYRVPDAVLAGIVDPEAVATCEKAGVGAEVHLMVGGKIDSIYSRPLAISGKVVRLGSAPPVFKKPTALVQVDGVLLVLLNEHAAFTDPSHFEAVGIDPLGHKIVVVKEGYLFQGLRNIAPRSIMALTPGFAYQLVENIPYEHVRRPIYPLDPQMDWSAR